MYRCAVGAGRGVVERRAYSAIRDNDLTRLQSLLKGGANPNVSDARAGATPLMFAAGVGSARAMTLLIEGGANVNGTNATGATALMWAATDIEKVRLLLSHKADVNIASQRGRTALQLAAHSDGSAAIVRLLLDAGADAKAVDVSKANTLHMATRGNDTETIRLIADAGADVNAVDFAGFTPLIHAASNRNLDAVRILLAKGADAEGAVWRRFVSKSEGGLDCPWELDGADGSRFHGDT